MEVYMFSPSEAFGSNMYLLVSENEAVIIDPSVSYDAIKDLVESKNLNIKYIFVTHSHFDHILEIDDLKRNTNAEVIVGKKDAYALSDAFYNCYALFCGQNKGYFGEFKSTAEGDSFTVGSETITVIDTPGHTRGSISLTVDKLLFAGDTIFSGNSYGRCDLPGGDFCTLKVSIKKLLSLSPEITVYSGHGDSFKISEVKMQFI